MHEVNYLTKPIYEMHEFPEHLGIRGHEVYFFQFPEGLNRQIRSTLPWNLVIKGRVLMGSEIHLITPKVVTSGLLGRLVAAATASRMLKRAIQDSEPDIIVSLAVPTFGWQAVRIAKKLSIPIVYRALDVSHLIRVSIFRPLVKAAERYVTTHANLISANNKAMADYVKALGSRESGVNVHYPPMDLEHYKEGDRQSGRRAIKVGDSDKLILYMGSFFYFSGLVEVIREFARLSPSLDTKLVLVGGGELTGELRGLVSRLGLEKQILFTGFVEFEDLPDYLSAADVLINPMKRTLASDSALPNKVIQYLAASKRVVSTSLTGVVETFVGYQGLQIVDSPEQCIGRALQLAKEPETQSPGANLALLQRTFGPRAIEEFESFLELAVANK